MFSIFIVTLIGAVAASQSISKHDNSSLVVTQVPDYVRPYAVRAYTLDGVRIGSQVYRFPVTGPSSDYAFTLISTAAPASSELGVLPHIHQAHYENFYNLRGRFALWASKDNSTAGRLFTPGDYGAVPHNTTHTFQILDPFTEMVGVIQPGGFEDLFYFLASANYSSSTSAPFPQGNFTSPGGDAAVISALQSYDVWAQLEFSPPMDFDANGMSGNKDAPWRNGTNELAANSETPFFVAKGYGPKILASSADNASYFVIEPFITATQSDGNFTEGTITMSKLPTGAEPLTWFLPGHTALEVVDGLIGVEVQGFYEKLSLSVGDVVFVPANTTWSFWGESAYSKVLYVGQGKDTLDARLRAIGEEWQSVLWPA
ncbi:hypothetical protein COCC4DRAFT_176256 [Bipolaris maydis ATCC 48331]|uniref:Cupin 2 conserved barrel domain-containing protein n=2 Tax=Cochliobolus heterostrophus TaxID=5016 RepID=M2U8P3_COCH5|nr:uncharacterized protein COCC4DRAFT_176256 [Bipolaris maydis ATCC 48331]EMD94934.1 hypothetical protein COCHEDRAFT_1201426 [Bipolaris maydis C5]KAJ5029331.1 RmlC-like cupin domain-containing protein [Bipolaris maydis]ENI01774.1 hypothetical protein COCC4DRAFT_176256 [Bipolaris maydis ATCC 48331]KAJ5061933.1 RmlC-like cupin domain-containing protein [Bipolaris maydis]KAJ6214907.1 RmlC-like cupin domain-containing protein [Bipolaris maydis]